MSAMRDISDLDGAEAVEAAQLKIEEATQNLKMMARALQKMRPGQKMERTNSQQSG